jgi:type VI secretion system protein ImpE
MRLSDRKAAESAVIANLRRSPCDVDARLQLFRLAAIDGNWARAETELELAQQLDAAMTHTCLVYRRNLACERERSQVFAGARSPVFLGDPPHWAGYLAQALHAPDPAASAGLIAAGLEAAEPVPGNVNGDAFAWLADADSRLGPMLECFIDGRYYWVPFERLERVRIAAPDDMLDLVWCACELTLRNGGVCNAYIPTRYPGTESAPSEALKLARRTEWLSLPDTIDQAVGQRLFVSDRGEYAVLDCREIVFGAGGVLQ